MLFNSIEFLEVIFIKSKDFLTKSTIFNFLRIGLELEKGYDRRGCGTSNIFLLNV